jgi:hypothetical protein
MKVNHVNFKRRCYMEFSPSYQDSSLQIGRQSRTFVMHSFSDIFTVTKLGNEIK